MKKLYKTLTCLLIAWISFQSCIAQTNEQEIEKREAAAGFFLPTAMALSILRLECRQWLAKTGDDVDEVARNWWQRNRDDLDVATWISGEAIRRYRSTMPGDQALTAERRMLQAFSQGQLDNIRGMFRRQLPSPELCHKAVQRYKIPLLDVSNLGKTPGYERFGEFGETLRRTRSDNSYRPADDKYRTFDAQVAMAQQPLASLDAIEAAKERHDSTAVVQGFKSLVDRGDRKAAQALGMAYLNGQYVPRNYQLASTWFYNAWAMGEPEGINALGVMARDAVGMLADNKLAIASFAVAKKMASNGQGSAFQRAASNYSRLSQQMAADDVTAAGCMKWEALNNKLHQLAAVSPEVLRESPELPKGTLFDSDLFETKGDRNAGCGN
jgi:hypothetical protein